LKRLIKANNQNSFDENIDEMSSKLYKLKETYEDISYVHERYKQYIKSEMNNKEEQLITLRNNMKQMLKSNEKYISEYENIIKNFINDLEEK